MVFDENYFTGEKKRSPFSAFPGKITKVEKQSSGNVIVTVENSTKDGAQLERRVIFKNIEIENHGLAELLVEGASLYAFGISSRSRDIFPVCIVKVKVGDKVQTIELVENEMQYKVALDHALRKRQQHLDKWSK